MHLKISFVKWWPFLFRGDELTIVGVNDAIWFMHHVQLWFGSWLIACSVPSHYLSQCWILVNWIWGTQGHFTQDTNTLYSLNKRHLKMSPANFLLVSPGLNVLNIVITFAWKILFLTSSEFRSGTKDYKQMFLFKSYMFCFSCLVSFMAEDLMLHIFVFQYVTGPHGTYAQMAYPQTLIPQMTPVEVSCKLGLLSYRWFGTSARLQYLQCVSSADTAVLD